MNKIIIIIIVIIIIFISLIGYFITVNIPVKPKSPTITIYVTSNATTHLIQYRISNSTSVGWRPLQYQSVLTNRVSKSTPITLSKEGSVYFFSRSFNYKFGGTITIKGSDLVDGQKLYLNAKYTVSVAKGEVYEEDE